MNTKVLLAILTVNLFFNSSCSVTGGLKEGETVLMDTKFNFVDRGNAKSVETFDYDVNLLKTTPTQTGLLNIYTGFHNLYDSTSEKGFKHWVKYDLGREPVYFRNNLVDITQARLEHYLNGKGFFSKQVSCDSINNNKKITIGCDIKLGNRYTLDSLIFPEDSTYASLQLDFLTRRAIIKEGKYYDRDRLVYERSRIASLARNNGFAEFTTENIFFYVDTAKVGDKVDIYMQVLQPTDSTVHTRYTLNEINIYPNYALNNRNRNGLETTMVDSNIYMHESEPFIKPSLMKEMIREEVGDYFNENDQNATIRRLLDLGIFQFVNINNKPSGQGNFGVLNKEILLTPEKMQSITGELELNNRSGNFFGSGASISYNHRNLFKGAERLRIALSGQIEAQIGDRLSFINSSDVNLDIQLSFPKFIVPLIDIPSGRNYIPRSIINSNFTFQRRIRYYTLNSLLLKYGFNWRETARATHEFYPITLNQISVADKTEEFESLLAEDPRLERSFRNTFLLGLQYYYNYSNQSGRTDRTYQFFRGEIETSGNLVSLFSGGNLENTGEIFGNPYAQFVKLTLDTRRYWSIGSGSIATRLLIGGGYAYGNSEELPYIKQYIIGGSNSVRAFPLRGLGPGSFVIDPEDVDDFREQFIDQTGDLKLEWNVEYRFPVFNYLKGAIFLEGGNVWLIDDEDTPEGNFSFSNFYREMGIGTGFGFRLDFNFFLLRLDLAFPLRAPEFEGGFNWQFNKVDLGDPLWRKNNLNYNIGIGYPF